MIMALLGWAVTPPGVLGHATVAQHSFWHELRSCRKDRAAVCLLEQKPGGQPQQTALESGAPLETGWARGSERHRGVQTS